MMLTSTPPAVVTATPLRRAVGLALAALAGAGIAVQSRINGELGARLHDGIAAACVSFGTGVLLLLLLPLAPAGRRGLVALRAALRDGSLRPWQCLGGVCGAYFVITQGVTVTALGVAVYTVAMVAGQSASSLAVDRAGVGPGVPQPLTPFRVVGALLAVVAVAVAVADRLGDPHALALALLPAVAGLGIAWQQAVNGRVRMAAGAASVAAFVNFLTGTVALLLAFGVELAVRGAPAGALPTGDLWLYLGGPIGIVFIAIASSVVRVIGVLLLGLGMIAGQLAGALVLAALAPAGAGVGPYTLAGVALTLVAVGVAAVPARRRRP